MRRWGLRTLLRLGPTTETTSRVCQPLSRDPDPYVRPDALKALGECGVEGLEAMTMASAEDLRPTMFAQKLCALLARRHVHPATTRCSIHRRSSDRPTAVVATQALAASEDPFDRASFLAPLL